MARGAGRPRRLSILLWLILVYAGLLAYLWLVIPTGRPVAIIPGALAILAVIIGAPLLEREAPSVIGLTGRNFGAASRALLLPTAIGLAAILAASFLASGAPHGGGWIRRFVQILPWALLQHALLQLTYNRRLTEALGAGWPTAAFNGLFFAGMHLPGPGLTVMTFVAGTLWSRVYQKSPNLYALVLSHALISATAQSFLPAAWTHGFRVGPGYFHWQ